MNRSATRRINVRLTKAEQRVSEAVILISEAAKMLPLSGSDLDDRERAEAIADLETIMRRVALAGVRKEAMRWDNLYLNSSAVDTES